MARVIAVTGPADAATIGLTLPHEHIYHDHGLSDDEDLALRDVSRIVDELRRVKLLGIDTIVDASTIDTGRDLDVLRSISLASDIRIIGSTGWFYGSYLPETVLRGSVEELVDRMERDVSVGTIAGARAGVIGEIGTSATQMESAERKVFEAAAIVHRRTGVPIYTHTTHGALGPDQVRFLTEHGVDPARIAVSHMDTNDDLEYHLAVATSGAYLSFDRIGSHEDLTDDRRLEILRELADKGHLERLLLSQDTARASSLGVNGGKGYAYILTEFLPRLTEIGFADEETRTLVNRNPARFLGFIT